TAASAPPSAPTKTPRKSIRKNNWSIGSLLRGKFTRGYCNGRLKYGALLRRGWGGSCEPPPLFKVLGLRKLASRERYCSTVLELPKITSGQHPSGRGEPFSNLQTLQERWHDSRHGAVSPIPHEETFSARARPQ